MKISVSVLKLIGLLLATVATNFNLYSQEPEEDELDLLLDELFFSDQSLLEDILDSFVVTNSIYANVAYSSNTYFYGRDSGTDQFNIVPQISYYHPSGFNISISGLYYETYNPNWDFTNVSLAYYSTIGKKELLNFNLGYTRFFYSDNYDAFNNSFDLNIGLRNRSRTLGTSISASYLFGTDKSLQITSNSYGKVYLLKRNKYSIKLRPEISFNVINQSVSYQRLRFENGEIYIQTLTKDIFDLVNTQVSLPLSFSSKSWDFEIGYSLNFPNAVVADRKIDPTSFFNLSIGYFINLNNK